MKRLISSNIITNRAEDDISGFIPGPAPYATGVDSYTQYLMKNPENKYIKRLKGLENTDKSQKTMEDVIKEYIEDDRFTIKKTK